MRYIFMKALKSRNTFPQAIQSLVDQVDHIYLAVDEQVDFTHPKVTIFITGNENADLDKILILKEVKITHNDHIFICDDDLIYPEDYIKYTISKKKSIASYGGSFISSLPIASYYQEKETIGIWEKISYNGYLQIPYSGVFYFKATKELVEAFSTKGDTHLPFACDLSIAGLLGALKLKCEYISPKEDEWFKHIKMDMSCTIYESFKDNDFEQTVFTNKYGHLFVEEKEENQFPFISVVIVVTRLKDQRDKVIESLSSIKKQVYPNYEIVMIEDYEKSFTIGYNFNRGVKEANAEWILFVADDDMIAPEYLSAIAGGIKGATEDMVCVTTHITLFDEQGNFNAGQKVPTGCWRKDYLLKNPFKENLKRYVDSEMFKRIEEQELKTGVAQHCYGYLYRSHEEQASGMKNIDPNVSNEKQLNTINKILENA